MKKLLCLIFAVPSLAFADIVNLNVVADKNICQFNKDCVVSGNQDIEIVNDSDGSHLFDYQYSLCVDDTNCKVDSGKIRLQPHTSWHNHHFSVFYATFSAYNRHVVTSSVHIRGTVITDKEAKNEILVN
jgi:hypothetical protein